MTRSGIPCNTIILRNAIGDLKNTYVKGKKYKIQMKGSNDFFSVGEKVAGGSWKPKANEMKPG